MTKRQDQERALWMLSDYYQIRRESEVAEPIEDYTKRYDREDRADREARMISAYHTIGSQVWRGK